MFVFRCICLLLISALQFIQCNQQFEAKHKINLGSVISFDASIPSADDLTFYGEFSLTPYTVNTISVYNFTSLEYGFGILQVHSCWYNLTLSYNKTIQQNLYENGTNLGFALYPTATSPQELYVHNYNYFTAVNVSVAFIMYNKTTPEPGGCNMEYPAENAPVLIVSTGKEFLTVDTPLAAGRTDESNEARRCNASLNYMGYHSFLSRGDYSCRSFFDGIKRLMTIDRIRQNGILGAAVPGLVNRRTYSTIPGTGMVFQTVVSASDVSAAYVPAFTISCSPPLWETSCDIFDNATYHVLAAILIIVGIIRAYLGSVLMAVGVFIDGFIFGLLVTFYTIYSSDTDITEEKAQQVLFIAALFVAILLTILYLCFVVLQQSFTLITNVIVGYLLGTFVVYFIDDNFYEFKSYGWMYETVFAGSILTVMIILSPCQSLGSIILSATCGTFCIIQGLCYIYGNHLNYVVLNALRYTSVDGFKQVHSSPATNAEDIWFLFLWLALCITAVIFQSELRKHRQNLNSSDMERVPLISRMTHGSDDVFESPESNIRFLNRLQNRRN